MLKSHNMLEWISPWCHAYGPTPELHPAPNAGSVVGVSPSYTLVYPNRAGGKSIGCLRAEARNEAVVV